MDKCILSCCCCILIPTALVFYGLGIGVPGISFIQRFSIFGLKAILYLFALSFYCGIFGKIIVMTHNVAFKVSELKEKNRTSHKKEDIQTNIWEILKIILINLLFLSTLLFLASYFTNIYIKISLILYISEVLGYVAAYPLSIEDVKSMEKNKRQIEKDIAWKTISNTLLFISMFGAYYYYF